MRSPSPSRFLLSISLTAMALTSLVAGVTGCRKPEPTTKPVNIALLPPTQRLRYSPAVAAINASGFDLLRRLDSETQVGTGNVFISPFSILQAMTMVTNGAGGETQAELRRALHLDGVELSAINADQKKLRALLSSTKKNSENSLIIANSLWVDKELSLAPDFINIARDSYAASAKTLDFSDAKGAANKINEWVDENTDSKIPTLFTPEELAGPPPTKVVLANAVYFKAAWLVPFSEADTSPKPFTLESGVQKTLPMMQQTISYEYGGGVSYYKGDGFAIASLAYDSNTSHASRSMLLLLPDASDGLSTLLANLTPENWNEWQKKLTPMVEVDLWLPRFTLEYEASLIPTLTQMGVKRAFTTPAADFAPMGLSGYFINLVKHKTFLQVNEKGTEAAAVTGAGAAPGGIGPEVQKVVFHVDRPFLCAIVDDTTGTILFLGVIRDPSAMP